ncbi:endo-alpha-N-acetylgalactosaminidase family protein [Streptomyces sp. NPDC026294]|uniref:endo-alpha-N-acetylgalactosaminidase family protein n=1 Tax=Streptomyces sp. NPDC026294 TaxID=3155362 RepID=UPI0033C35C69
MPPRPDRNGRTAVPWRRIAVASGGADVQSTAVQACTATPRLETVRTAPAGNFSLHVNATEPYPVPRAFSEKLVNKNDHQWDWLGQSYRIDQRRNLVFGDFAKRFAVLRAQTAVGRRALHRGHAGPLQEPRTL